MWLTVQKGTGEKAKLASYLIGGKTGTAEKPGLKGQGYGYNTGRAGLVPRRVPDRDDPRYLVLAVARRPARGRRHEAASLRRLDRRPGRRARSSTASGRSGRPPERPEDRTARSPSVWSSPKLAGTDRRSALRSGTARPMTGCRLSAIPARSEIGGISAEFAGRSGRATCSPRCAAAGPTAGASSPTPWPAAPSRCWATRRCVEAGLPSCRRWSRHGPARARWRCGRPVLRARSRGTSRR